MKPYDDVIQGTAQQVMAELAHVPPGEHVRVIIGRPSLSLVARRLQATAAANGITADVHDELLRSLKQELK